MKFYDDIFDQRFLFELVYKLKYNAWYADNVANRKTFPYGDKGTHQFLGQKYFIRENDDQIIYNDNKQLSNILIDCYWAIQRFTGSNLRLAEIFSNLQYKGMDGTFHKDGSDNQKVYILMLSDEIPDTSIKDVGGEFINETFGEVAPFKFGRVIEFKASDSHKGMSFTEDNMPRISVRFMSM